MHICALLCAKMEVLYDTLARCIGLPFKVNGIAHESAKIPPHMPGFPGGWVNMYFFNFFSSNKEI